MTSAKCICGGPHEKLGPVLGVDPTGLSVTFVFKGATRRFGSVQVRSRELARLLEDFEPQLYVDSIPLEYFKGGTDVIIASKTITKVPGVERFLRRATKNGTKVLFDLVDGNPRSTRHIDRYISAYICSSHSEYDYRMELGQKAYLVPHNVDARMKPRDSAARGFRVGYSGAPYNAQHLDNLEIDVFDSSTTQVGDDFNDLDRFLGSVSHHYSVRQNENRVVFKPAVKTYIASMYNRAFIGSKEDPETLKVLGSEYPYLAQTSSLYDVTDIIEFARATFGGPVHERAMHSLQGLRQEFCPRSVAELLYGAIVAA